jgi:acyl-[acyl-carrier-protein]-phospholipid O-acyltransferase/long-chain-fatty-acid--[acyl-carrier-protein] ligase
VTAQYDARRTRHSVLSALLAAGHRYGGKTVAIVDGDERPFTYAEIARAAFALGSALHTRTGAGETVGVMLPTGIGPVIAFYALHAANRLPAMLNFTTGAASILSACRTAKVKRIVTARKFIELAGLTALESELANEMELIYLEDVREKLSPLAKLTGLLGPYLPFLFAPHPKNEAPAVILFTSGTEGEPKGVVLSHHALLANVEQVRCHLELYRTDTVFNPLPTFHCFGLTVGVLMPLILGLRAVMHPSPLQARTIAKRIQGTKATILLATDTFISQYARAGDENDLSSLRLAVCGAERVRDETRQTVRRRNGIDILEGYGVTEAAPVVAANQPGANRHGTIGHLMPEMQMKLEPVEGIEGGGRLLVRGPNLMLGYLQPGAPGEITPPDGWYDTGDIAAVDEDGYITIRGRLKRFAKIGGEMISLAVVENCASAVWADNTHAAVALPDERKGEQIVLLTDCADANRTDLIGWARSHGVSELNVPKTIVLAGEIPVLGTGKIDYAAVEKTVIEQMTAQTAEAAPTQGPAA